MRQTTFSLDGENMNLGKSVHLCRVQRGISQSDLAERAGLSTAYISLIEANKRDVPLSTVRRLSEALGVPMSIVVFLGADAAELATMPSELREKLADAALFLMNA
jgi:transcriptional regulator with XRE-family HTH domain